LGVKNRGPDTTSELSVCKLCVSGGESVMALLVYFISIIAKLDTRFRKGREGHRRMIFYLGLLVYEARIMLNVE
jgi:hypothetical protein